MAKKIVKEAIIILLLCLAIILVMTVLFYDYAPNNKIIPEKQSYVTPENVKQELSKTEGVDDTQVIMTYEVDSGDLKNYQRINSYVPGKPNPFSSYKQEETGGTENPTGGNTTSGNTTNNNNGTTNNSNTSSGESEYSQNKGTK